MDFKNKIIAIQNLLLENKLGIVVAECKKLLKKHPKNGYIHNICGLAFAGQKKFSTSIEYFNRALYYDPENLAAMNNLANSYKAQDYFDKAEGLYLKIIEKDSQNLKALNNYANLKQELSDFEGAIVLLFKALKINPTENNILFSLASCHQNIGNFEKSLEFANKLLKVNPKHFAAHQLISGYTKYQEENKESKKHLETMEELSREQDLNEEQKIHLFFALGKAHEDLKNYEQSFQYLEKANFLKKQNTKYKIDKDKKIFKNIIKTFDGIDLSNSQKASSEKKIVFICGMPRSGTTLVEQIIASHNLVSGAGELTYLQNVIRHNFFEDLNLNKQKIIEKSHGLESIIEKEYMQFLDQHKFNSKIITDKAPQNFRWIGFMRIFFPNCKIIHCSRNPKDNCLSIFKNSFPSNDMDWSHDQKDTGEYYNLYLEIMKFWKKKLPGFIYDAKYEKIVSNSESEIKKLINFCDLGWDPDCLNFHKKNKTPIQTVSASQARKPIYQSSVNSNVGYSKYLQEMYDILGTH